MAAHRCHGNDRQPEGADPVVFGIRLRRSRPSQQPLLDLGSGDLEQGNRLRRIPKHEYRSNVQLLDRLQIVCHLVEALDDRNDGFQPLVYLVNIHRDIFCHAHPIETLPVLHYRMNVQTVPK